MKVLVTGVGGQLGYDVVNELVERNFQTVGSDILGNANINGKASYIHLDITDREKVEQVITEINPGAVIHCAAWTAVDLAEDEDKQSQTVSCC
jgi:dTDP-4-dehydrorhamnose reductase